MLDLTFLEEEQIFGDNSLEIFKKYGRKSAITDFAILLGGEVSDYFYSSDAYFKGRTGNWYTKTIANDYEIYVVDYTGNVKKVCYEFKHSIGFRPTVTYSSILSSLMNEKSDSFENEKVNFGEYPQWAVDTNDVFELENAYNNGILKKTGKIYTTDTYYEPWSDRNFQERKHIEYEYKGRKYIRFVGDYEYEFSTTLSNNILVKNNQIYWIEVKPILWIIDKKADIALSKYILFSGVQFKNERNYDGDFNKAFIKQFMDNYFSKEILINQKYLKNNQFLEENNENLDDIFEEATLRMNQINGKVKTKTL